MPTATGAADPGVPDEVQELIALVRRAEVEGDSVLPELRAFFDKHPSLWQSLGDLARRAELALADLAAAGDIAAKEAILRHLDSLKAELAGPDAPPLERLLAADVAVAWLAAAEAEIAATRTHDSTPPRADFYDKRRDRARRRLESAVKTMAVVRKLLRPALSPIEIATRGTQGRRTTPASTAGRRNAPAAPIAN